MPVNDVSWNHTGTLGSTQPEWTRDPSIPAIERIVRDHLPISPQDKCEIAFFAQGGFNKLYSVFSPSLDYSSYLFRVPLPVEPHHKTLSEVATLTFVRDVCHHATIIPKPIAFEAKADRDLGFEWILMERMNGEVFETSWGELDWTSKENIIRELVVFHASLFEHQFRSIGNIYAKSGGKFEVGRIVSMLFFWEGHQFQDVDHGPFRSSYNWLGACLAFILNDAHDVLRTSDDEGELEDAEMVKDLALRLANVLPCLFPPNEDEPTALCHDDLSWHNLLLDSNKLSAILDWECVSVLPLWKVCQLPSFLISRSRQTIPNPALYSQPLESNEVFKEHVRESEQTKLRVFFLAEMDKLQPKWTAIFNDRENEKKADFDFAINMCSDGFVIGAKLLSAWLGDFEEGREDIESLRSRCLL